MKFSCMQNEISMYENEDFAPKMFMDKWTVHFFAKKIKACIGFYMELYSTMMGPVSFTFHKCGGEINIEEMISHFH